MSDTITARSRSPLAAGASRCGLRHKRKTLPRRAGDPVARSDHRARRPRGDRGRQSEAGRFSRLRPGECRSGADPRSAHGAIRPGAARPSRRVRTRHREPTGFCVCRTAKPQARRTRCVRALKIGAIHTYLELYARTLVDLTPQVALVVADKADRDGNLYTGPNTEDTPTITEAAAFRGGIVVAQVNEIVDHLPRVDVPGDWVDFVIPSPKPYLIDPLFTRDPAKIRERERPDGDDGDRRRLRALRGAAAQPRHRLCHRSDRTDSTDLCRRSAG